jgi:hypothetical protein
MPDISRYLVFAACLVLALASLACTLLVAPGFA